MTECCQAGMPKFPADNDSNGGIVKDLKFEIPTAVQNVKGVHIKILLESTELFRGDLSAVKAGDFNFSVPDSFMHNGENKLVVEFFVPPSDLTIAQSILVVDMGQLESNSITLSQKRIAAAVGATAVIGLGLHRVLRGNPAPVSLAHAEPTSTSPPSMPHPKASPLPEQDQPPATQKDENRPAPNVPLPKAVPLLMPQILTPKCSQFTRNEMITKQLDLLKNNKLASAVIGAAVLSRLTSTVVSRFGQKAKVDTTPIVCKNFGKARNALSRTWNAARRIINGPI